MSDNTGTAQIGVTGLAVMGRNLARNLARHGFTVALHNRHPTPAPAAWSPSTATRARSCRASRSRTSSRASSGRARSSSWSRPAARPTRSSTSSCRCSTTGDIVIDCGNAHFADTRRREAGADGARPALRRRRRVRRRGGRAARARRSCPAGPRSPTRSSARSSSRSPPRWTGTPCCVHVGPDGAGHFVKMVHNGIEYADMQLIAEAYDLLRSGLGGDAGADRRHLPRAGTPATSSRS